MGTCTHNYLGYYNDHHCTLPANVTKEEMIPVVIGPDGDPMYDQCMQYNYTGSNVTVQCPHGWDFDPEYFDPNGGTIVMEVIIICYFFQFCITEKLFQAKYQENAWNLCGIFTLIACICYA